VARPKGAGRWGSPKGLALGGMATWGRSASGSSADHALLQRTYASQAHGGSSAGGVERRRFAGGEIEGRKHA
jgi:hypothetical protein